MKDEEIEEIRKTLKDRKEAEMEVFFSGHSIVGAFEIFDVPNSRIFMRMPTGATRGIPLQHEGKYIKKILLNQEIIYEAGKLKKLRLFLKKPFR